MKYLHTMIRVKNLEKSLHFYKDLLGLKEIRRNDYPEGRFTLVFLAANKEDTPIELTYNWDNKDHYSCGRNFGHLAFAVDNIYKTCQFFADKNVKILRPPRDGRMAFVRCPDNISIELLQKGDALLKEEPWSSMHSQGEW